MQCKTALSRMHTRGQKQDVLQLTADFFLILWTVSALAGFKSSFVCFNCSHSGKGGNVLHGVSLRNLLWIKMNGFFLQLNYYKHFVDIRAFVRRKHAKRNTLTFDCHCIFKFFMASMSYFETSSSFEPQNYFSDTNVF